MKRREPFRQLRTEDCKSRQAAKGREMARTGIVADKNAGPIYEPK